MQAGVSSYSAGDLVVKVGKELAAASHATLLYLLQDEHKSPWANSELRSDAPTLTFAGLNSRCNIALGEFREAAKLARLRARFPSLMSVESVKLMSQPAEAKSLPAASTSSASSSAVSTSTPSTGTAAQSIAVDSDEEQEDASGDEVDENATDADHLAPFPPDVAQVIAEAQEAKAKQAQKKGAFVCLSVLLLLARICSCLFQPRRPPRKLVPSARPYPRRPARLQPRRRPSRAPPTCSN